MSEDKVSVCAACEMGEVKSFMKNGTILTQCDNCGAVEGGTIQVSSDLEENGEDYELVKQYEKIEPEEFFGDESSKAIKDISDEFGEDEIAPFGSTEDPKKFIDDVGNPKYRFSIHEEKELRGKIRKMIAESNIFQEEEIELDEERIVNSKSKVHVNNKENFIGSHIFGEDLGGLGKMYVAYSYGEQFPVYVCNNGKWYHNTDTYNYKGETNSATEQHKEDMRPSAQTSGMSLKGLQSMIKSFMKKNNIGDVNHKEVEPGEKN